MSGEETAHMRDSGLRNVMFDGSGGSLFDGQEKSEKKCWRYVRDMNDVHLGPGWVEARPRRRRS